MTANRDPLSAPRERVIGQLPQPNFGALVLQESSSALGEHNSAPCQTLHLSLLTTHRNLFLTSFCFFGSPSSRTCKACIVCATEAEQRRRDSVSLDSSAAEAMQPSTATWGK